MTKKYKYRIIINSDLCFANLLRELIYWGIKKSLYKVDWNSNIILTSNNNVVDVITETFVNPDDYNIIKFPQKEK